jgi:4-diphosphocytidyl-2-C-methyl-D-erythritol kinase
MAALNEALLDCPAPAKINLFLHVTGRRADGYHLLQTAFRMLDYGDSLSFHLRKDGEIHRISHLEGVPPESDLCVRAARLLQSRSGCKFGADISIEKKIPMGGGLGGGSSDAATVLLALNRLWQLDIDRPTLQQWALELGADVPFFVFGRTAIAEGVGEELRAIGLPESWYVVLEPPVSVPTAEIFRSESLTRDTKPLIISGSSNDIVHQRIQSEGRNDLQPVACSKHPVIQQALDALSEFGSPRMSGSGACVFLSCGSAEQADVVVSVLRKNWRVWKTRSLEQHPLHGYAQD